MCCDGWDARPKETVGECPACGSPIDADGDTTEAGCNYSPSCPRCGDAPCDQSC